MPGDMTDSPGDRAATKELLDRALGFQQAGRGRDAETAYRDLLDVDPDNAVARHNLAVLTAQRGDAAAAVDLFDVLIAAQPHYVSAHLNRANALRALGRTDAAIHAFRTVVALEPDHHDAHRALGFLWLASGERDRALDHFARTYDLRRGEDRSGIANASLRSGSVFKLKHDSDLFRNLPPRARDGQRFEMLARLYDSITEEMSDGVSDLTDDQLETLGADYNTPIHLVDTPEVPATQGGALNRTLDGARIEQAYRAEQPGVAWFDDLLSPVALDRLLRFLQHSTIWHDFRHIGGFVATYLEDGLACPLMLQIADEIRAALPGLLADQPLTQAWAFKGLVGDRPIDVHADDAAISLNFWVTPDAANRNPDTGGLRIYRAVPPADWPILDYDADRARITDFLDTHGDSAITVPYRQNRAVLFDSRLFHGTDAPDFTSGYSTHRINITLLFGTA